MKQKAITISMLKSENGEQRMTSLEIAQLTGKQHKNVMQAIRNMETAWEKVNGLKFQLVEYRDQKGELRPCYSLTKTECLYIATKFNDEARARLVLRWQELEMEDVKRKMEDVRCLPTPEEILNEADDIIGDELDELNKASDCCYTPSEIGKVFGLEGRDLNSFLCDQGIIEWSHGQWQLTRRFRGQGLTENRCFIYHNRKGQRRTESRLVWTEKGRDFVLSML